MQNAMRAARKRSGMTTAQLADAAGIGAATISNWENGVYGPTVVSALLVCRVLGITISEYVGDPMLKVVDSDG